MCVWTPFLSEIERKCVRTGLGLAVLSSRTWRRRTTEYPISATLNTRNRHGLSVGAVKIPHWREREKVNGEQERRAGWGGCWAERREGTGGGTGQPLPFRITLPGVLPQPHPPAVCLGSGLEEACLQQPGRLCGNYQPFVLLARRGGRAAAAASTASLALCSDSRTAAARWR